MSKAYIDSVGAYFYTHATVSLGAGLAAIIAVALFSSISKIIQIKARNRKINDQIDKDHFNDWLGAEGYVHFSHELHQAEFDPHAESTRISGFLQKNSEK